MFQSRYMAHVLIGKPVPTFPGHALRNKSTLFWKMCTLWPEWEWRVAGYTYDRFMICNRTRT